MIGAFKVGVSLIRSFLAAGFLSKISMSIRQISDSDCPACSKYTCRAYILITCQKGFKKRCEHECLRLLFVDQKMIAFERNLSRVRDHMSDDVIMNYVFPTFNDALGVGSSDNSPRSSLPNNIEFCDDWIFC